MADHSELVCLIDGTEYGCGLNQKEAFNVFTVHNENFACDVRYLERLKRMVLRVYGDVQKDVSFAGHEKGISSSIAAESIWTWCVAFKSFRTGSLLTKGSKNEETVKGNASFGGFLM